GANTITVREVDAAGNASESAVLEFTLDTSISLFNASLTNDNDGIVANQPEFSGSAEPNSAISIELTNVGTTDSITLSTNSDTNGNWSIASTGLSNGEYSWTATITDKAGNQEELNSFDNFTLDTPLINRSLLQVRLGDMEKHDEPSLLENKVFNGESKPNTEVTLNVGGKEYKTLSDSDGDWVIKSEFSDRGVYQYQLDYTDDLGNEVSDNGSVTVGSIDISESPSNEHSDSSIESSPGYESSQQPQFDYVAMNDFELIDNHNDF
ncbi:Ig-like domain-containing protein, partial [Vibrio owensii]